MDLAPTDTLNSLSSAVRLEYVGNRVLINYMSMYNRLTDYKELHIML